jgi:hypothetical protein
VVEAFGRLSPQLSRSARPLDHQALARIVACPVDTVLLARSQGEIVGMLTLVVFPIPSGLRARSRPGRGGHVGEAFGERGDGVAVAFQRGAFVVGELQAPASAGCRS